MTDSARRNRKRIEDRGSTAVAALEQAWQMLRESDSRIPRAVLVVLDTPSRGKKRGHFAMSSWQARGRNQAHEIGISPNLFSTPAELMATMAHEAVHVMLWEEGSHGGMGAGRYYHTKVFRDRCVQIGLECEFWNTRYGWTQTRWPPGQRLPEYVRPIVAFLKKALPAGGDRPRFYWEKRSLPESGQTRLSCNCSPERSIYVAKSVAADGGITCCLCNGDFS